MTPTSSEFVTALRKMRPPNANQRRFLKAHYDAPGRFLTATALSEVTTYKDYRGVNRWYGDMAKLIGAALKLPDANLSLLVDFLRPKEVTNEQWLLVMRPEFAEALSEVGWI